MVWQIVPQIEKIGKMENIVDCKHVRFFPKKNKQGMMEGFGMFGFPILKVIISNGEADREITWSNRAKQDLLSESPGKFIVKIPPLVSMVAPKFKAYGKQWDDDLSDKVAAKGTQKEFESHKNFADYLAERFGQELSDQVMDAFASRLIEFVAQKMAA